MKKTIVVILALTIIVSLCACASSNVEPSAKPTPTARPTPSPTPKVYTRSEIEDLAAYYLYNQLKNGTEKNGSRYSDIYNIEATTYSIGSVTEVKGGNYQVKGTLSLYDDYGRIVTSKTFSTVVMPWSSSPSIVFIN